MEKSACRYIMNDRKKTFYGVSDAMLKAEHWTSDDSILMERDEIISLNESILSDESLRRFSFRSGKLHAQEERRKFVLYNLQSIEKEPMYEDVRRNVVEGLSSCGSEYMYGVCISRTVMLKVPVKGSADLVEKYALSPLHVNQGAVIYASTADREWSFVRSEIYYGWVPSDTIALFHDKESMIQSLDFREFLTVTGESVSLETNLQVCPLIRYEMGDRIRLFGRGPGQYEYSIGVFTIDACGYVQEHVVPVRIEADVTQGYLPLSRYRFLKQCFKCLNTPYRWGGATGGRDCSSLVMEVFQCFGVAVPRNSQRQLKMPGLRLDFSAFNENRKKRVLEALPTGSLLFFPGHVMVYLGSEKGEYFVISSMNQCRMPDRAGVYHVDAVTVNDLASTYRINNESWMTAVSHASIPYLPEKYTSIINREKGLPEHFMDQFRLIPMTDCEGKTVLLEEKTAEAYERLRMFLLKRDISIGISSGYRNLSEQEEILHYNRITYGIDYARDYVALPGHSEHHTGLAVDIAVVRQPETGVAEEDTDFAHAALEKAAEHFHKFGFILRYPKGKKHITGQEYEPWHLRYVGMEAAKILYHNGDHLAMEEIIMDD